MIENSIWPVWVAVDNTEDDIRKYSPGTHKISFNDFPSTNTQHQVYIYYTNLFGTNIEWNGNINGWNTGVFSGYRDDLTGGDSSIIFTGIDGLSDCREDTSVGFKVYPFIDKWTEEYDDDLIEQEDNFLYYIYNSPIAINNQPDLYISKITINEYFNESSLQSSNTQINCNININSRSGTVTLSEDFDLYIVNKLTGRYFNFTLKSGSTYTSDGDHRASNAQYWLGAQLGWMGTNIDQAKFFGFADLDNMDVYHSWEYLLSICDPAYEFSGSVFEEIYDCPIYAGN